MEDKNVGSVNANNGTECCSEWWDLHNHLTWKISYLSSSELYSNKFFSQQCVYRYSDWLCSAFVKCPVQLEAVTSPSPPRQPSGIWQWSVPREWGIWHKRHSGSAGFETCPGEVGNLNRNCSESLSSGVLSSFNFCHRGDTNLTCAHTSTTHSVLGATASSWSMTVLR